MICPFLAASIKSGFETLAKRSCYSTRPFSCFMFENSTTRLLYTVIVGFNKFRPRIPRIILYSEVVVKLFNMKHANAVDL